MNRNLSAETDLYDREILIEINLCKLFNFFVSFYYTRIEHHTIFVIGLHQQIFCFRWPEAVDVRHYAD